MFFSMLDLATYAAYCLMEATTRSRDSYNTFKLELGYDMTIPLVKLGASLSTLTQKTTTSMKVVGSLPIAVYQDPSQSHTLWSLLSL